MNSFASYHVTVAYLETLIKPFGGSKDPGMYLKRMQDFLDLVGNPEKGLKVVHVTGTAGKGSVAGLIQSMLVKNTQGKATKGAARNIGLFTSPNVTTNIEKIQVNELYISPADFVAIVEFLKPAIEKSKSLPFGQPSYFEIIFAIALEYFKRQKSEWVVLEVGLGGRYDATNIVQNPAVTVITNIGYDHMNILGKTLSKIAWDKAGIIKRGSVFFTAEPRPQLRKLFKKICSEVGAKYNTVQVPKEKLPESNHLLASTVARHLGVDDISIQKAIAEFKLPARFELIQKSDITNGRSPTIIIDGAHNESKIANTVAKTKKIIEENAAQNIQTNVITVVAFSQDKDVRPMLEDLFTVSRHFYITRYDSSLRNAQDPADILAVFNKMCAEEKFKNLNIKAEVVMDPLEAFEKARVATMNTGKTSSNPALEKIVLVTGSFYLAGTIRAVFHPEAEILKNRSAF